MLEFIKTTMSALKTYVDSKLVTSKANWNQNDSSADDYIKNKTHWEETKKIELFNSREFLWAYSDLDWDTPFSSNVTYKVIFDGVAYECLSYNMSFNSEDYVVIGNSSLSGDESGLGDNEPFFITCSAEDNYGFISFETLNTVHVLSLYSVIDGVETTIWDNTEFDTQGWYAYNKENLINDIAITNAGEKYNVTVNGQTYEFVSKYDSDESSYYLGLYSNDPSTSNIPFGICTWGNDETWLYSKELGYYDIEVAQSQTVIHTLDEKYLPEKVGNSFSELYRGLDNTLAKAETAYTMAETNTDNLATEIEAREALSESKMDKENPTGTGSFSMNRLADSTIGKYSAAFGYNCVAEGKQSFTSGNETIVLQSSGTAIGKFNKKEYTYSIEKLSSNASHKNDILGYRIFDFIFDSTKGLFKIVSRDDNYLLVYNGVIGRYYLNKYNIITIDGEEYANAITQLTFYEVTNYTTGICTVKYDNYTVNTNTLSKYAFTVGNGTSDDARSNAHTIDWEGNSWYAGDIYTGGTGQDDENAKKLASEEYVDNAVANAGGGGVFTVNITVNEDESYSADKTFDEIVEAHESGKVVMASCMDALFPCIFITEEDIGFEYVSVYETGVCDEKFYMLQDNTIEYIREDKLIGNINNLTTNNGTIVDAINELNAKHTEGTDQLILLSPNGTRFSITVGDDGVLSATEITE